MLIKTQDRETKTISFLAFRDDIETVCVIAKNDQRSVSHVLRDLIGLGLSSLSKRARKGKV